MVSCRAPTRPNRTRELPCFLRHFADRRRRRPTPGGTMSGRSASADRRQPIGTADIVDDLQHAVLVWAILHAELRNQAGVVDEVIAARRPATDFLGEANL